LLLQSLLLGVLDVSAYNRIELASKVLTVIVVSVFWILKFTTVEAMLLGFALVQITTFIWILSRIATLSAPGRPEISLRLLQEHIGLACRAYFVLLSSFLVLRVDLFMVKYMLGEERAGQYSVAASMADYVVMLPVVAGTILFPKLSSMHDPQEKLRLAKKAALLIGLLMLPVVVLSALLAKPLVMSVFGQAYLPAAQAFVWLMPGIFFLGVESVAVQFLNSIGYPSSVVITWLVCVVVNVSLNLWGIPFYGIVGASLSSSITYILASVLIIWIVARTGRLAAAKVQLRSEVHP
jgi:O-antigen/teichoic acid export membrane protein